MKRIVPMGDNLLIKPAKKDDVVETKSGIILAKQQDNGITNKGVVLEKGEGRLLQSGEYAPLNFEKGDHIIFNSFAGVEIEQDEEEYLIIKANDIIAKIK